MACVSTVAMAQSSVGQSPTGTPAVPSTPAVTPQRIEPIIAPVTRAKPTTPKIDPAVAASLKAKAGQVAATVKNIPKQDALAAAKAALASAKVAVAKAMAAKKAPKKVAAEPTGAKTVNQAPAAVATVQAAAKVPSAGKVSPPTPAAPASTAPAIAPAAKPL